ncbi:MAG: hypothetical protein AMXMBFR84_15600 [Candidatus Hydrogenedentota bacterium]
MSALKNRFKPQYAVWAVFACFLAPIAIQAKEIEIDAALGTPVVLASQQQTAYLRVAMTGFKPERESDRAPVNIAFVLDKSGSMQGEKIENAKQAVRMAIGRLNDRDIVSIVAYDTNVLVLVPATRLTDRASIYEAVEKLSADHSTALFAGVSRGAAELRKFLEKQQVNRIILLSDGLANVGPSSPGELGDLGRSLGRDGIAVSTIGLGLDYNEDLMTRLAMASDGNHMFAERPSDLDDAFAREFGDVLAVVAQQVNISIRCAAGIRPVRVLGREAVVSGQNVMLTLNQLYSDQTKYLILEVEVPAGASGSERDLAFVQVDYSNLATGNATTLNRKVTIAFTDDPTDVKEQTNEDVMAAAVLQIGVEQNKLATRLRDEGKIEESRQMFISNSNYLIQNAAKYDSKDLEEYSRTNSIASENLDETNYKRQRKVLIESQQGLITQQKR